MDIKREWRGGVGVYRIIWKEVVGSRRLGICSWPPSEPRHCQK